jgi:hypothetical protein
MDSGYFSMGNNDRDHGMDFETSSIVHFTPFTTIFPDTQLFSISASNWPNSPPTRQEADIVHFSCHGQTVRDESLQLDMPFHMGDEHDVELSPRRIPRHESLPASI